MTNNDILIEHKTEENIYNYNNVTLNDYFEYEINEDSVCIHLPKDLHEEFRMLGKKRAIAQIGVHLIDAINKIKNDRNNGNEELKRCKQIYMISPIFYSRAFYPLKLRKLNKEISIESPVLTVLNKLGVNTRTITANQLQIEKNLREDSEIQLAYKHFGNEKDIGCASLSFEQLNTEKWKNKLKLFDIILKKYSRIKEFER